MPSGPDHYRMTEEILAEISAEEEEIAAGSGLIDSAYIRYASERAAAIDIRLSEHAATVLMKLRINMDRNGSKRSKVRSGHLSCIGVPRKKGEESLKISGLPRFQEPEARCNPN